MKYRTRLTKGYGGRNMLRGHRTPVHKRQYGRRKKR